MAETDLEGVANGLAQALVLAVLNDGDSEKARRYIEVLRSHALGYEHQSQRTMLIVAGRCEEYLNLWSKDQPSQVSQE